MNPAAGAKPKNKNRCRPKIRPMTAEQARAFLKVAATDRLFAFYSVLLSTGMRPSELFGLFWPNVDLEGGPPTIRVEQVLVRVRDRCVPPATKDGSRPSSNPDRTGDGRGPSVAASQAGRRKTPARSQTGGLRTVRIHGREWRTVEPWKRSISELLPPPENGRPRGRA